jgi:hypothetical protein
MTLLKKHDNPFDYIAFPGIWDSKTPILKMHSKTEEKSYYFKIFQDETNLQWYDIVSMQI